MGVSGGERERRSEPPSKRGMMTRSRVLAAAAAVFGRQGYVGTTMQEVAAEAGVASGTAYQYFIDKADLFHHVLTDLTDK